MEEPKSLTVEKLIEIYELKLRESVEKLRKYSFLSDVPPSDVRITERIIVHQEEMLNYLKML